VKCTKVYIQLLFDEHPYFSSWHPDRKKTFFVHAMTPSEIEANILSAARALSGNANGPGNISVDLKQDFEMKMSPQSAQEVRIDPNKSGPQKTGTGISMTCLDVSNFDAHQTAALFEKVDFAYLSRAKPLCARIPGWTKGHVNSWITFATTCVATITIWATGLIRKVKRWYKRMRVRLITVKAKQSTFSGDFHKTTWGNTWRQTHLVIFASFHYICPDGTRLLDHINMMASGDDLLILSVSAYDDCLMKMLNQLFAMPGEEGMEKGCGYLVKEITKTNDIGKFLSKEIILQVVHGKVINVACNRPVRKLLETGVWSVNKNRELIKKEFFNWMIQKNLESQFSCPEVAERITKFRTDALPMEPPGKKVVEQFGRDSDYFWKYTAHKRTHKHPNLHWTMGADKDYRLLISAASTIAVLAGCAAA
jgi:hypothetical protein